MNNHVLRRPTILIILDGFGLNPNDEHNAVAQANTPRLGHYFQTYPFTSLQASGAAVGLPEGQMGNSEVGHMTIGCGSILRQDLVRIDDSIKDGSFFQNEALVQAIIRAGDRQRPVHLVGLVSDGGVHSHINHLFALIDLCQQHQVRPVLHMITDGRDTPPQSATKHLPELLAKLEAANGKIATISGRFYAMDRDKRWERTRAAWEAMVFARGEQTDTVQSAIAQAYEQGITDEFIKPSVIAGGERILPGDEVIFFNFRNDRVRQLTYTLSGQQFKPFDRSDFHPVTVTCLTQYDPELHLPIAFAPESPKNTLGSVVSEAQIHQFHCAETEKYAHVTFFLNGGREAPYPGEQRIMVPSPKVTTYDLAPEMSAHELASVVINAMQQKEYGFIVVNFANGDMVGHTAKPAAIIKAVETLDVEVGRVLDSAIAEGYSVLLTADHGNCDEMIDSKTGEPHTQHTTHPVPCMIIDTENWELIEDGGLSNIAPTVLELMGLEKPPSMTSKSLLKHSASMDEWLTRQA